MIKQRSKMETKRMVAPKKDRNFKLKAKKQVNPANSEKVSYSRKQAIIDSLYQDNDAKKSVMERAEEVLHSIPEGYPRFSKVMLPSNVSYSFWLILPLDFCKFYMPNEDVRVILVDDHGKEKGTTYLAKQHGLSAGWGGFAIEHRLLEGDILVFHMVSPYIFKVNIVRVYGLDVADAALILMLIRDSRNITSKDSISRKSERKVKKLRQVDNGYADVPEDEGSGITEYKLSNELNYCRTHQMQEECHRHPSKSFKSEKLNVRGISSQVEYAAYLWS